ncbi:MAG: tRNA preQ1(34) S-adenosylmethionine ribosyltransferase-isomerase QueA [Christensenellales bacterium]|jgi:S-adenosylmethionine:tRNA ribosyltransferase-isomerase
MKTSDFSYTLPDELIAQHPAEPRDSSRLLVVAKDGGLSHNVFHELPLFLKKGDALVVNDTRVIPARLYGKRQTTGGAAEFLLLNRLSKDEWRVILKPGKKAKPGARFVFGKELSAQVVSIGEDGERIVRFEYEGAFESILDKLGNTPLPPYITEKLSDPEKYQTVYSREPGSAAAPTAGLHFTPELLDTIKEMGIPVIKVLLHVGLGTFRPVKSEYIDGHKMHSEYYELSEEAARAINGVKAAGGRIVAVGTTTCRVLETAAKDGVVTPGSGWTDIFIKPGYRFQIPDMLITNFHLPESTLMMLISAFAGRDTVLKAYKEAVEQKYRFFSFGDACLFTGQRI